MWPNKSGRYNIYITTIWRYKNIIRNNYDQQLNINAVVQHCNNNNYNIVGYHKRSYYYIIRVRHLEVPYIFTYVIVFSAYRSALQYLYFILLIVL